MFQTASAAKLSGPAVLTSLLLHCAAILLVCLVSFSSSPLHLRASARRVVLIAPALENPARPTPKPPRKLVRPPRRFEASPPRALDLPPVLERVRVPLPEPTPAPELPRLAAPPAPPPVRTGIVAMDRFEKAQPVTPPLAPPAPPITVKAAGFAAAENAGADLSPRRLTAMGGFETASGATATRRGGITRASGFAAERAAPVAASPAHPATHGASGFGDASVATPSQVSASSAHGAASSTTVAAEILDKPRPSYTGEARRLKIEGEVLLEVVFEASGETKVLRVIRGLGHGLDEAAMAAARQIRFRPARRGGAAIDSSAVVHIVFQLAY